MKYTMATAPFGHTEIGYSMESMDKLWAIVTVETDMEKYFGEIQIGRAHV